MDAFMIYHKRVNHQQNGVTTHTVQRHHVYLDQIMNAHNKQSAAAAATMFQACMEWINKNLPFIKYITVQSDQAKCYNSNFLKLMIGMHNCVSNRKVLRFIHTGVQSGKCLIDAHFAHAANHVKRFVVSKDGIRRVNIATERGLYRALARPGLKNHYVQLVQLDHNKLEQWESILEPAIIKLKAIFNQCAEIDYKTEIVQPTISITELHEKLSLEAGLTLKFCAYAYSGIDGTTFTMRLFTKDGKWKAEMTFEHNCFNKPNDDNDADPDVKIGPNAIHHFYKRLDEDGLGETADCEEDDDGHEDEAAAQEVYREVHGDPDQEDDVEAQSTPLQEHDQQHSSGGFHFI